MEVKKASDLTAFREVMADFRDTNNYTVRSEHNCDVNALRQVCFHWLSMRVLESCIAARG